MSASDFVLVWKWYTGTLTDMMFLLVCVNSTLCLGYRSACSKASEDMRAEATVKDLCTVISSSSTSARRARTSRTVSRNCFISSSRLSFSSLWPRWAVRSLPFRRVSSIRVGFTVIFAIGYPLLYSWSFFGQYFSIYAGLIRFSSLLGRMLRSSQPRSSVSSMERFSS